MPALPRQALLGVVGGPDVERRQRIDGAPVGDRVVRGDLGPGADADPVGLHELVAAVQRVRRGLAVAPHALLERARELGPVGLAHQVGALMVERRVQEETLVIELEVLLGFADAALAERESCSPSASARTVTAHSLKAIGMR